MVAGLNYQLKNTNSEDFSSSSSSARKPQEGVIFTEEVNGELICDLAENPEIFAVVIPEFYPREIAAKLAEEVQNSEHLLGYQQAPSILRTAMTFSETESSPERRDIYHEKALSQIDQTRKICWPFYPPVDLLRLQLDERYPYGSHLMSLGDRAMFSGLIRSFEPGVGADPHQDVIFWDSNLDLRAFFHNQIAANIYLQTQSEGGELELWDHKCKTQTEIRETVKMTEKLYLADPKLKTIEASVVDFESHDSPSLELDQTCFHPQGGGQKADRGYINAIPVTHVEHTAEGGVKHYLDPEAMNQSFEIGQKVMLVLDWEWRMLNARLHTGGHLIAALLQESFLGLQPVNAQHWPKEARVEFMGELPKPEEVREILPEQLSSAIAADLPVTITGDPYQNRGIMIGDYPSVPCGGTHVENLSFLKQVEINKVKVKKDRLRVSYSIAD